MHEPSTILPLAQPTADLRPAPAAVCWSRRRKLVLLVLLVAGSWGGLAVLLLAALQVAEPQAQSGLLRYLGVL